MIRCRTNDIACHRVLLSFTQTDVAYILETASSSNQLFKDADIASAGCLDNEWGLAILLMHGPVRVDWVDLDRREIQVYTLGNQGLNYFCCFIVDCNLKKKKYFQKLAFYLEELVDKSYIPA